MNNKDYKTTRPQDYKLRLLTFVFSLLSLVFFASSCSTNKETSRVKMISENQIIKEIDDNRFAFDNLEARIGVSVKGDNLLGLKGQMRIQNDSVIWISLSLKLGIEVGRIMITPDSIKYINRNTRTYLAESLDYFNDKLPVVPSLQFFQNILVGNDTQIENSDRCRVTTDDNSYRLEFTQKDMNIIKDVCVNAETFRINEYMIKELDKENGNIHIQYDEFQNINGRLIPTKIILEVNETTNQRDKKFSIEINYSDIKTGEKLSFPFNVSSKFEQIYLW